MTKYLPALFSWTGIRAPLLLVLTHILVSQSLTGFAERDLGVIFLRIDPCLVAYIQRILPIQLDLVSSKIANFEQSERAHLQKMQVLEIYIYFGSRSVIKELHQIAHVKVGKARAL